MPDDTAGREKKKKVPYPDRAEPRRAATGGCNLLYPTAARAAATDSAVVGRRNVFVTVASRRRITGARQSPSGAGRGTRSSSAESLSGGTRRVEWPNVARVGPAPTQALDQSRAHGFVPTCADEPRTCKPAPCRNGNLDYLGSLMHLPEQNAVVCTVPKAGCTTVSFSRRGLRRTVRRLGRFAKSRTTSKARRTRSRAESKILVASIFIAGGASNPFAAAARSTRRRRFGHKRNLKNMRPSAAMRLMKNASGRARGRSMRKNDGRNRAARERSSRPRGERRSGKRSRL